jgi:hypothetical protein
MGARLRLELAILGRNTAPGPAWVRDRYENHLGTFCGLAVVVRLGRVGTASPMGAGLHAAVPSRRAFRMLNRWQGGQDLRFWSGVERLGDG